MIDPIDGTKAFVSGVPLWGTLVGLLDDGVPGRRCRTSRETFAGIAGTGAHQRPPRRPVPLRTRATRG